MRKKDGYVAGSAPQPPRPDSQGYVLNPAAATPEHAAVYSIPMDTGQDDEPVSGANGGSNSVLYCIPSADVGDEINTGRGEAPRSGGADADGKSSSA